MSVVDKVDMHKYKENYGVLAYHDRRAYWEGFKSN